MSNIDEVIERLEIIGSSIAKYKVAIEERLKKLEDAYQADFEVAKDIIADGATVIRELNRVKSDCAGHHASISALEETINRLEERCEKIEFGLIERIGKLGRALSDLSKENHELKQNPFECPICKGMCKFKVFGADKEANCPACKGKGIVWK